MYIKRLLRNGRYPVRGVPRSEIYSQGISFFEIPVFCLLQQLPFTSRRSKCKTMTNQGGLSKLRAACRLHQAPLESNYLLSQVPICRLVGRPLLDAFSLFSSSGAPSSFEQLEPAVFVAESPVCFLERSELLSQGSSLLPFVSKPTSHAQSKIVSQ
jgi:hypothetical protein